MLGLSLSLQDDPVNTRRAGVSEKPDKHTHNSITLDIPVNRSEGSLVSRLMAMYLHNRRLTTENTR